MTSSRGASEQPPDPHAGARTDGIREQLRLGWLTGLPAGAAVIPVGLAFGVLVIQYGLPWWVAPLLSGIVFAGSIEFLLAGLLAAGAPLVQIALTALIVNFRHAFYALTFPLHRIRSIPGKTYGTFALTDEAFALTSGREAQRWSGTRILTLEGTFQLFWVASSTAGALLGSLIPLAVPFLQAGTGISPIAFIAGMAVASTIVDVSPFSTNGALVLANFGKAGDLVLPDGRRPDPRIMAEAEKGSIIVVLATDLPLDHRQLARVCRRAGAGIARLGAFYGNGSGDIVLGFTTRNRVPHHSKADVCQLERMADRRMDDAFRAACEATQEAILNAMCAATAVEGRNGATRPLLSDWLRDGHNTGTSEPL